MRKMDIIAYGIAPKILAEKLTISKASKFAISHQEEHQTEAPLFQTSMILSCNIVKQ